MKKLHISHRISSVPTWALLERSLFEVIDRSVDILLEEYLTPEGEIIWPESVKDFQTFAYGNMDNAFEGFATWPLFYLLGGDERFLKLSERAFFVLTKQFSRLKKQRPGIPKAQAEAMGRDTLMVDGWFGDMDWMHQGEAALLLYHLCTADPQNEQLRQTVLKIAEYTIGESPVGLPSNYDPEHKVFRSCYLGTNGPSTARFNRPVAHQAWMNYYGLAFHDVPGVTTLFDLDDPEKSARYGQVCTQRLEKADTVTNLLATSMVTMAYLYTGEERYRQWVLEYVAAWRERYAQSDGPMPDNAGPTGKVGETMDGRWYGGHYGWTYPHGFWFIADAMIVGGENERLLTGRRGCVSWVGEQLRFLDKLGIENEDGDRMVPYKYTDPGSVIEYLGRPGAPMTAPAQFIREDGHVRYLQNGGWYEYTHVWMSNFSHLYLDSFSQADMELARSMARQEAWNSVTPKAVMSKYKGGQDAAFLHYLSGTYTEGRSFPEEALSFAIDQVYRQLDTLRRESEGSVQGDGSDNRGADGTLQTITAELRQRLGKRWSENTVRSYYVTFLLERSTVTTEALVQLTMGGSMPIYNGGLLNVSVLYLDAETGRPGLPRDVAALISDIRDNGVTLTLLNLHPMESRRMIIRGGAFGEHRIVSITTADGESIPVDDDRVELALAPGADEELVITLDRWANRPALRV